MYKLQEEKNNHVAEYYVGYDLCMFLICQEVFYAVFGNHYFKISIYHLYLIIIYFSTYGNWAKSMNRQFTEEDTGKASKHGRCSVSLVIMGCNENHQELSVHAQQTGKNLSVDTTIVVRCGTAGTSICPWILASGSLKWLYPFILACGHMN